MKQSMFFADRLVVYPLLSLVIMTACGAVHADQPRHTIPDPGFRPHSEYTADFISQVDSAQIAVLPTIIRRPDRTAHSFESQRQIVNFLNDAGIGSAIPKRRRIDIGRLYPQSQWNIFNDSLASVAEELSAYDTRSDFVLVMEILVPAGEGVFGIEIYILDAQARSVFSFLLNSHHQLFAEAELVASDSSEEARLAMIENATEVGLAALELQIGMVRDCMSVTAKRPKVVAKPGVLYDFQSLPAAVSSANQIPLGFSTFTDGTSKVQITTTSEHPAMPEELEGNAVLKLSVDVTGWAGFVSLFHDEDVTTWTSQDWSGVDGISFWLYGHGSGAKMFVDILDNRDVCSKRDDAERYVFNFTDDAAGWRRVTVRFSDMTRKEIGNMAPNDGLTLREVHGWGIGTLDTGKPLDFYVDDFSLWRDAED